jgi:hypothetical protein
MRALCRTAESDAAKNKKDVLSAPTARGVSVVTDMVLQPLVVYSRCESLRDCGVEGDVRTGPAAPMAG